MHDFRLQGVDLLQVHLFSGFAEVGRQRLNQGAFVCQHSMPKTLKLVAALRGCEHGVQHALLPFKEGLQVFHGGCQK